MDRESVRRTHRREGQLLHVREDEVRSTGRYRSRSAAADDLGRYVRVVCDARSGLGSCADGVKAATANVFAELGKPLDHDRLSLRRTDLTAAPAGAPAAVRPRGSDRCSSSSRYPAPAAARRRPRCQPASLSRVPDPVARCSAYHSTVRSSPSSNDTSRRPAQRPQPVVPHAVAEIVAGSIRRRTRSATPALRPARRSASRARGSPARRRRRCCRRRPARRRPAP